MLIMSKEVTKQKRGLSVHLRPKSYPITTAQKNLQRCNETCGIKKGMTRAELVKAMKECVPEYYRRLKEKENET